MIGKYRVRKADQDDLDCGAPPGWMIIMPRFGFSGRSVISGFSSHKAAMDVLGGIIRQRDAMNGLHADLSYETWTPNTTRKGRI